MKLSMRVLSFCHYLQGPAATQYLADLGADVIKIEPLTGAFERHWSGAKSFIGGVSAFSLAVNRNKRSLAIDLKHPAARAVVLRLIDSADVVVENFRSGVIDRLGFGYDEIRQRRPDIIYASATGLGPDGPDSARPGQDLLMQARSGLIAATGSIEAGPTIVGAAVVDQHGGSLLAMGILAAFVKKLQTGSGTRVEGSLFQSAIDLQMEALTMYFAREGDAEPMPRGPNIGSWYHDAPYGAYALTDCHIVLSMNDPVKLADALESNTLRALSALDRYAERERYAKAVSTELRNLAFADISGRFDKAGIWFERVQSYDDLAGDRQAAHIGAFSHYEVGGLPVRLVSHPLRYDGASPDIRSMPLAPGCDTRSILAEAGFETSEIDRLVADGVVAAPGSDNQSHDNEQAT